jgi:hypothetical protein
LRNSSRHGSRFRMAFCTASTRPNAAATPIAGAPRTTIVRMALATSEAWVILIIDSLSGRMR